MAYLKPSHLERADQQNPNDGYDQQALAVSEQARARTLLELIKEGDINRGIDPQLKKEKENLEQQITGKTQFIQKLKTQFIENLAQSANPNQLIQIDTLKQEIEQLENQLETLEAEIRDKNPDYARLTQIKLNLNAQDIQQKIVDDNTILLSYWLGKEESYLWLVTPNQIISYTLPPQAEIETLAEELINYAQDAAQWDQKPKKANAVQEKLSQMLLSPVAELIGDKRLIIIPHGGLQYLPFSLLVNPQTNQSLIATNQIVNLPSASTLDAIRNQQTPIPANRKEVAIFADAIFNRDDPRLPSQSQPRNTNNPQTLANLTRQQALDEAKKADVSLNRLEGTKLTAEQILALVPNQNQAQVNLGFEVDRPAIFNPNISQYRLIHIATHGFFNQEKPELSGVVLSLYDEQGNYQLENGFLLIPDIFNLNLPADLVVLSACNTVEGKEVKGEGIVGLTRGFMYAGAKTVVMTLWDVDDETTTIFMTRFYEEILKNNLTPAEALRNTQLWMREKYPPQDWAGFVLQGEWK